MAAVKSTVVKSIVILCSNSYTQNWASQVARWVKKLPAVQETQEIWAQFLGPREDPLAEGMATHSSIAWRIPWTEEPGRLQSIGHKELNVTEATEHTYTKPKTSAQAVRCTLHVFQETPRISTLGKRKRKWKRRETICS